MVHAKTVIIYVITNLYVFLPSVEHKINYSDNHHYFFGELCL